MKTNTSSSTHDDVYVVTMNRKSLSVLCDMNTAGGGWTVSEGLLGYKK